jgi:hypothetical protein
MVYLQATLEVKAAGLSRFCDIMAETVAILEGQGWKLVGAFVQRTGRLHTVIDLWELEDFNHYDRALRALTAHPRFPHIKTVLEETVTTETVVFADKAPYMH